jgi:PKD repeat protein
LRKRYLEAAVENQCIVSPAGAVWRYIRQHYPEIELYEPDNSHPSFEGTYATAACFYASIFKKSPQNFSINYHLPDSTVQKIKTAVDAIVSPQDSLWQLDIYKTKAQFTYTITGVYVQFNNTSKNASAYEWIFGDGDTAEIKNPVHAYPPGQYPLTLIAKGCHGNDTLQFTLKVPNENSVTQINTKAISLHPAPATNQIMFNFDEAIAAIQLINYSGQVIFPTCKMDGNTYILDLKNLPEGVYYLTLKNTEGKVFTSKFNKL